MAKRIKGRMTEPGVHSGRVLRWDDDEGWGVLGSDEFPGTVFAHFSHLQMEGYWTLTAGQGRVTVSGGVRRCDTTGFCLAQAEH